MSLLTLRACTLLLRSPGKHAPNTSGVAPKSG
jgi:hypothetical protein